MARERDLRLDVLKAAAIALVVLGHVIILVYGPPVKAPLPFAVVFTLLSAVHVPLFVFVSGYLAPADADLKWLGRRAVRLLVPYFAWAALQWVAWFRGEGVQWFLRIAVSPGSTNALWFLFVLFELCVLYVIVRRSTALMVAVALCCLLVPPIVAPWFSLAWVTILFPVFVAGQLAGRRRFEPGWWMLPLAALLLAAMWTTSGANLTYATPAWAAALPASWSLATGTLVRAVRLALQLSLIGTAFLAARGARRGAWIGCLTLAIYCAHPFFLPAWARGGGTGDVVAAFAVAFSGAVGVALLVRRWETTSFLLLGSGVLPAWVRRRLPARG